MNLSKNFQLLEFTKSQTAMRRGIDNTPPPDAIGHLRDLCFYVLQPLREDIGRPIIVNSGFRCLELNRAIGSKDTSQHIQGQAADIEAVGLSNLDLFNLLRKGYAFDQLILEFYQDQKPASGWVHVSYANDADNRGHSFRIP